MKYLRIHNVSTHINFYQNRFINECVRKTFLKFPERKDGKPEFFLWDVEELTFLIRQCLTDPIVGVFAHSDKFIFTITGLFLRLKY